MYICEYIYIYIYIYIQRKKGGDRMFDFVKVREWTKEKRIGKKSESFNLQREEERRNLEAQLTTHRHTQTGSDARARP